MKRPGSKYQAGDRFVMDRSYGNLSKGDPVTIQVNLGKRGKYRTWVRVTSNDNDGVVEEFPVTYLGRRIKR